MANLFDLINEERDRISKEHKSIDPVKEAEFWKRYEAKAKAEQEKIDAYLAEHPEDLEEPDENDEDEDE